MMAFRDMFESFSHSLGWSQGRSSERKKRSNDRGHETERDLHDDGFYGRGRSCRATRNTYTQSRYASPDGEEDAREPRKSYRSTGRHNTAPVSRGNEDTSERRGRFNPPPGRPRTWHSTRDGQSRSRARSPHLRETRDSREFYRRSREASRARDPQQSTDTQPGTTRGGERLGRARQRRHSEATPRPTNPEYQRSERAWYDRQAHSDGHSSRKEKEQDDRAEQGGHYDQQTSDRRAGSRDRMDDATRSPHTTRTQYQYPRDRSAPNSPRSSRKSKETSPPYDETRGTLDSRGKDRKRSGGVHTQERENHKPRQKSKDSRRTGNQEQRDQTGFSRNKRRDESPRSVISEPGYTSFGSQLRNVRMYGAQELKEFIPQLKRSKPFPALMPEDDSRFISQELGGNVKTYVQESDVRSKESPAHVIEAGIDHQGLIGRYKRTDVVEPTRSGYTATTEGTGDLRELSTGLEGTLDYQRQLNWSGGRYTGVEKVTLRTGSQGEQPNISIKEHPLKGSLNTSSRRS